MLHHQEVRWNQFCRRHLCSSSQILPLPTPSFLSNQSMPRYWKLAGVPTRPADITSSMLHDEAERWHGLLKNLLWLRTVTNTKQPGRLPMGYTCSTTAACCHTDSRKQPIGVWLKSAWVHAYIVYIYMQAGALRQAQACIGLSTWAEKLLHSHIDIRIYLLCLYSSSAESNFVKTRQLLGHRFNHHAGNGWILPSHQDSSYISSRPPSSPPTGIFTYAVDGFRCRWWASLFSLSTAFAVADWCFSLPLMDDIIPTLTIYVITEGNTKC